jgi:NAD(P)H-flavin reductase
MPTTPNRAKHLQSGIEGAHSMVPVFLPVYKNTKETHDTHTLFFRVNHPSEPPYSFKPGQFNMLYVFGKGEIPVSVSSDPDETKWIAHTIRKVGKVSSALFAMKRNERVGIRGPFGSSWDIAEGFGRDVIIVAGGLGLAPLRPLIANLFKHRDQVGNAFLLYGARTPDDLLYYHQLQNWRSRFDFRVRVCVDHSQNHWLGSVCVVPKLIHQIKFDPTRVAVFICGPEIMMKYTIAEFKSKGVPALSMFVSLERNMKCAIGICGHCQYGPHFVCKDGPVFCYKDIEPIFDIREI